jgi:hypothetical protein
MSDSKSKLEAIKNVLTKLEDIENSYTALIEKTGILVLEMMDAGLDSKANSLNGTLTETSNNAKIVKDILNDLEIKRNKIQSEG